MISKHLISRHQPFPIETLRLPSLAALHRITVIFNLYIVKTDRPRTWLRMCYSWHSWYIISMHKVRWLHGSACWKSVCSLRIEILYEHFIYKSSYDLSKISQTTKTGVVDGSIIRVLCLGMRLLPSGVVYARTMLPSLSSASVLYRSATKVPWSYFPGPILIRRSSRSWVGSWSRSPNPTTSSRTDSETRSARTPPSSTSWKRRTRLASTTSKVTSGWAFDPDCCGQGFDSNY